MKYPMVDEGFLRVLSFQRAKLLSLGQIQIWLNFIMTSNRLFLIIIILTFDYSS